MKKVVVIAPEGLPIPPVRGGSVQIYLHELLRHLGNRKECEVTLLAPGREEGKKTANLRKLGNDTHAYQKRVLRYLNAVSPDIVQIDNRPLLVPVIRRSIPQAKIVLNLHSITFLGPLHITKKQGRAILRQCDAVVVNSDYLRKRLQRRFQLQPEDWRPHIVYPGVTVHENATAKRPPVTSSFLTEGRTLHLLFVGRVIEQKGVHVILEAMRLLQRRNIPTRLTIVGRTPPWEKRYRAKLLQSARGLPVNFTGFVKPANVAKYYEEAHLLLCPSQRDEAFGLVNIEAMARGIPVIASQVGGIPEIVNGSCGILIRRYTEAADFADAVESLYRDRKTYQSLSAGAKQQVRAFRWEQTAEKFVSIYQAL